MSTSFEVRKLKSRLEGKLCALPDSEVAAFVMSVLWPVIEAGKDLRGLTQDICEDYMSEERAFDKALDELEAKLEQS